jgi:hypothetical protein
MKNLGDVAYARLYNQRLAAVGRGEARTPAEVVGWLGAMQAQDFAGAKWSLGLRLWPTSDAAIEQAFNEGTILRTHMLRPTWHFVTPADIRWLLALTAPRIHQVNAGMYRQVGMDSAGLKRSLDVVVKALQGGQATRDELREALQQAGIPVDSGLRMAYVLMNAELEGIICSGPRRGKQFTYMLLDERAPNARSLPREAALAELIRRYFTSHGPATAEDFARWTSLTLSETRAGLAAVGEELQQATVAGQTYWFTNESPPPRDPSPTAHLVSIYDEYTIGYKDHSPFASTAFGERMAAMGNALQNVIVIDGQIAGTWRREVGKKKALVELSPFAPLEVAAQEAVAAAAEKYRVFLEVKEIDLRGL